MAVSTSCLLEVRLHDALVTTQVRRSCILANVVDAGGHMPEEVLRVFVDAMRGACTRAVVQVGVKRLLTWQPGA